MPNKRGAAAAEKKTRSGLARVGRPPLRREPEVTPPIVQKIEEHLRDLNWPRRVLAEKAGFSEAKLSLLMSSTSATSLEKPERARPQASREDVCRLAWAIAGGLDEAFADALPRSARFGARGELDAILNDLLDRAGYAAVRGHDAKLNRAWAELTRTAPRSRRLKFAWFPWGHAAQPAGYDGFCIEVSRQVCQLLGAVPEPVQTELDDLPAVLESGAAAFAMPLMRLPARLSTLRFSNELPRFAVGAALIVHETTLHKVLRENEIDSRTRLAYAEGSIGDSMGRMLAPRVAANQYEVFQTRDLGLAALAAEPEVELPNGGTAPRCFITDEVTAHFELARPEYAGLRGLPKKELHGGDVDLHLPVAFAVSSTEPMLLDALNACIAVYRSSVGVLWHMHQRSALPSSTWRVSERRVASKRKHGGVVT